MPTDMPETLAPTKSATPIPATPEYTEELVYNPEDLTLYNPKETPVFVLNDEGAWIRVISEFWEDLVEKIDTAGFEISYKTDVQDDLWYRLFVKDEEGERGIVCSNGGNIEVEVDDEWLRVKEVDEKGDVVAYIDYVPGKMVGNDWVHRPEEMMTGGVGMDWSDEFGSWVTFDEKGEAVAWFNAVESTTSNPVWVEVAVVYEEMEPEVQAEVKAVMPELWYYNDQNELVTRNSDDFEIKYMDERHLHLIALDGDGNKIAWADFHKTNYEKSIWYSVTDVSEDTLMPISFAAKMGEFIRSWTVAGGGGVKHYVDQAVIRFSDEGELWVDPGGQDVGGLANDVSRVTEFERNLGDGEAIMEAYVIRLATELYNLNNGESMTVGEMRDLISRGEAMLIDVEGEEWDVSKGVEVTWIEVAEARYVASKVDSGVLKIKMSTRGAASALQVTGLLGWDVPEDLIVNEEERLEVQERMVILLAFPDASRWKVRRPVQVDVLNR